MARANHAPRGFDGDCAIFLDDFIDRRIGEEAHLAPGAGLGHSRQIFERMKCRLPRITQRVALVASAERDADQTLDRCADRPHGIEFLIDHVRRHIVALKEIAVETPEIAIDLFVLLNLLDAIDRRGLALIKELRLLFALDLLHLAHQIVAQRRQMRRGARRHAARDGTAIDHDDRASALAQLIGRREACDSAANDGHVAPFVSLQRDGLRRHGNRHPKRFAGHGPLNAMQENGRFGRRFPNSSKTPRILRGSP